jgi:hypothetical protein
MLKPMERSRAMSFCKTMVAFIDGLQYERLDDAPDGSPVYVLHSGLDLAEFRDQHEQWLARLEVEERRYLDLLTGRA